ncbi:bis-aminopropyl spermidine synthase family protein [Pseudomonas aeruginosa]
MAKRGSPKGPPRTMFHHRYKRPGEEAHGQHIEGSMILSPLKTPIGLDTGLSLGGPPTAITELIYTRMLIVKFDLRSAINSISDVVMNRPAPLREFDQIYMKVADMVVQAEYVARVFNNKKVVFVGDGDGIALSAAHLKAQGVIDYGPSSITLLDFDERIVNSVLRFGEKLAPESGYHCSPLQRSRSASHRAFRSLRRLPHKPSMGCEQRRSERHRISGAWQPGHP